MNIGIDIDGVLCSEDLFQLLCGAEYHLINKLTSCSISPFASKTDERFHWPPTEDFLFWHQYYIHYLCSDRYKYPDAEQILRKLHLNGHKIFVISNRSQKKMDELKIKADIKKITENWLVQNHLVFDQLFLTDGSKLPLIKEYAISFLIDDNPKILMEAASEIEVAGFRAHCNLRYPLKNIHMVSSWLELESLFVKKKILREETV